MEQKGALKRETIEPHRPDSSEAPAEQQISAIETAALDAIRALQQPGAADLLQRVIELYVDDATRLKACIAKGIQVGDADMVRDSAHSLKSSSASVGASRVATLCRDLEEMSRSGTLVDAELLFAQLDGELSYALVELVALKQQSR